jgi:hypothetical protein
MPAGGREIFVYYRVAPDALASALPAIRQAQALLMQETPGLQARVLRRPAEADGNGEAVTVMETYAIDAHVSGEGIAAALQARIETCMVAALGAALQGPRHVEVFVACA